MSLDRADTCYRHPDRNAGVQCQRCARLICPECMRQASVGFHCPECTRSGQQQVYTTSTLPKTGFPITYILIAVNVAVFVVGGALGDGLGFGEGGGRVDPDGLIYNASTWGPAIDLDNEWWRVLSGGFLHHGLFHLAVNMFSLYILGLGFERSAGRIPFGAVYFAALVGGSFGALLETPNAAIAGASGAIFGLLGAYTALAKVQGIGLFRSRLGPVLALNLFIGLTVDGISLGGHIGGFVAGLIVGTAVALTARQSPDKRRVAISALLTSAAVVALSFVGALWAATRWVNAL